MQKLFLFDFDGVIVDSLDVYEGTVTRCLKEIGQPIVKSRADFLALYEDNFYESLVKKGVDLDAFMAAAVGILAEINYDEITPFHGVLPVLAKLRENNILVVISSSDSHDINTTMVQYHFDGYFREVLGSDANLNKKKKILHVMARFGTDAGHTYYVGDTMGDIKEGKMAGVKTVAVTWGWHTREQLAAVGPDYLIDQPEDLLKI
jgi:phosphoglycolate phosphatase